MGGWGDSIAESLERRLNDPGGEEELKKKVEKSIFQARYGHSWTGGGNR